MAAFATVEEYHAQVPEDTTTANTLIETRLAQQSAKLRGLLKITDTTELSEDAKTLAQFLVIDAVRKCSVSQTIDGIGEVDGVTQASFTANGFQQSFTLQNPSGAAYFDTNTLKALRKLLGKSQSIGICAPFYGSY